MTADPKSAELGRGGVFTAVVTKGKRDLLKRLLDAGIQVPRLVTGCQSYILEQPDMLKTLLDNGMYPDTCNWQNQLCFTCSAECRVSTPRFAPASCWMLAQNISLRDDDLSSTPLAWAARHNNLPMVKFLLFRAAATNLPDDKPWATPLAWATRRENAEIAQMLREAGAKR
jgi:ankyrin repeat protein